MHPRIFAGLARGLLCAALLPAAASATTRTQLWVDPSFSGGPGAYSEALVGTGPLSLAGDGGDGNLSAGSGSSFTDYGVIRMAGNFSGSGTTGARGSFREALLILAPGVPNGSAVQVDFQVLLVGALVVAGPPGNAYARWGLDMALGGPSWNANYEAELWNASPSHVNANKVGYLGDDFGMLTATATVQVGSNEILNISLEARAQVTFQNGASQIPPTSAGFELGQSLYWGGITAMRRNGVAIDNFSAIGQTSGLDWRQSMLPVPEPASGLLMLAGLAAAGLWRRSRG